MARLPEGTVTFLFTDIEGSTRLVEELGAGYLPLLEEHQRMLRQALATGSEVGTEGDSFFVVFLNATDAVAGTIAAQRALAAGPWPEDGRVRVPMGMHSGQGVLGGDSYVGIDVHRAARIAAAAHGGQVLLSDATRALVDRQLPDGVTLRDLGSHWLKDLATAERLFQLVIPGLLHDFPPIASAGGGPRTSSYRSPRSSVASRRPPSWRLWSAPRGS